MCLLPISLLHNGLLGSFCPRIRCSSEETTETFRASRRVLLDDDAVSPVNQSLGYLSQPKYLLKITAMSMDLLGQAGSHIYGLSFWPILAVVAEALNSVRGLS